MVTGERGPAGASARPPAGRVSVEGTGRAITPPLGITASSAWETRISSGGAMSQTAWVSEICVHAAAASFLPLSVVVAIFGGSLSCSF